MDYLKLILSYVGTGILVVGSLAFLYYVLPSGYKWMWLPILLVVSILLHITTRPKARSESRERLKDPLYVLAFAGILCILVIDITCFPDDYLWVTLLAVFAYGLFIRLVSLRREKRRKAKNGIE